MVVVAILGILAAVAVPAFLGYRRRAHTAEVPLNLNNMYKLAASLYSSEYTGRGATSLAVRSCVASPSALTPATPGSTKQSFVPTLGFQQLGFTVSDMVLYGYAIDSIGLPAELFCSSAGVVNSPVYTFRAQGDLDADTILSTFELAVGSDHHGHLYHAAQMFTQSETE